MLVKTLKAMASGCAVYCGWLGVQAWHGAGGSWYVAVPLHAVWSVWAIRWIAGLGFDKAAAVTFRFEELEADWRSHARFYKCRENGKLEYFDSHTLVGPKLKLAVPDGVYQVAVAPLWQGESYNRMLHGYLIYLLTVEGGRVTDSILSQESTHVVS